MLKTIRLLAWAAIAALALIAGTVLVLKPSVFGISKPPFQASIGGPFTLTAHDGKRLSSADLKGQPFALFFGFTNCPDVCPTSMLELSETMKELGADADKIRFLFVTVDPERDTAAHLKEYLANFDTRITGLVGTPEEVALVAKAYRAYYEKVTTTSGYTMNHTATIYLMGREGQLFGTLAYQEDAKSRLAKLRRKANADKKVGIKLYVAEDATGEKWTAHVIDDNTMACEDLKIADLNADGKPDLIASGRATHNVVIYWNKSE